MFFREQILKLHQQETEYLEAATFALEQHYAGIDSEARQDYQGVRDDIKNQVLYCQWLHSCKTTKCSCDTTKYDNRSQSNYI